MPKNQINQSQQSPKICVELFALTYGSCVLQLIKDYGDVNLVNSELEKMGYK